MKLKSIIKDKEGGYADVFIFIIMAFIIVLFFGIWYYASTQLNNVLGSVHFLVNPSGNASSYNNFTNIVNATWGEVYDSYGQLRTMAYVLIFGMILTILVSAWTIRSPPLFLIIYILVSIAGIIVGVFISNVYQNLLLNPDFGSTLQSFTGASYLLLYLPYLAGIIALLSGLISLIGLNRSSRESGGYPA